MALGSEIIQIHVGQKPSLEMAETIGKESVKSTLRVDTKQTPVIQGGAIFPVLEPVDS